MSKEGEEKLFDFSLSGGDIEIPDVPEQKPAEVNTETNKEKVENKVDDFNFIEIPDEVETQEVTEEDAPEEKETKPNTNTEDKNSPKKQGSSSSSPYKPFAKALFEEGVLSSFDEEEFDRLTEEFGGDAVSALIEVTKRNFEADIEAYKEESEAEYKAFLDARDNGVNLNDWAVVQDNKKRFAQITEEMLADDEKVQKQLIRENLIRKGMEDADITETIESYEDTNKLASQAKKALESLKKDEDNKEKALKTDAIERDKQQKEAVKKQTEDLRKQITSTEEIIPGMKLNKQVKDEIFNTIMKPVKTLEDGRQLNEIMVKRMEDPIRYAILEAYFVKQGFFDKKFDKLVSKSKAKATLELEKAISGDTSYRPGKEALAGDFNEKEYDGAFGRIAR